jgi:hypothetical protein
VAAENAECTSTFVSKIPTENGNRFSWTENLENHLQISGDVLDLLLRLSLLFWLRVQTVEKKAKSADTTEEPTRYPIGLKF